MTSYGGNWMTSYGINYIFIYRINYIDILKPDDLARKTFQMIKNYIVFAFWDDSNNPWVSLGVYATEEAAWSKADTHLNKLDPFSREHVDYYVYMSCPRKENPSDTVS